MRFLFILLPLLFACSNGSETATLPATKISGPEAVDPERDYPDLFKAVQMGAVFPDSKTFADCAPMLPIADLKKAYREGTVKEDFNLKAFVEEHFQLPRQYSSGFKSDLSRSMPEHINALWPILTRKGSSKEIGTLLPLPNDYIVPGGRFGEIYYWDSYFTMLGLMKAGKEDMVENMIDNFAHLINTVGHIPNGNRTYFLHRSQPPFYAAMVDLLAAKKGDSIYKKYQASLLSEYKFWMDGADQLSVEKPAHRRVIRLADQSILNRYWDDRPEPRPESYKEDVALAKESKRPAEELFRDLRAACESGWDFSSRWFADGENLSSIETTKIIPVDLNCLLYNLELSIAKSYNASGNAEAAADFQMKALDRQRAIMQYCWDKELGYFTDYNWSKGQSMGRITMAGMFPLFFGVANETQAATTIQRMQQDLLKPGGLVTTTVTSGQQWDAPNGWAPLQWIGYQGMQNYDFKEEAADLADKWLSLNEKVYKHTGKMVEKYNVVDLSLEAGGGEYPVQDGFGWTNGVALALPRTIQ